MTEHVHFLEYESTTAMSYIYKCLRCGERFKYDTPFGMIFLEAFDNIFTDVVIKAILQKESTPKPLKKKEETK